MILTFIVECFFSPVCCHKCMNLFIHTRCARVCGVVLQSDTCSIIIEGGESEEHTSELQSHHDLVCRLLLEKKKNIKKKK